MSDNTLNPMESKNEEEYEVAAQKLLSKLKQDPKFELMTELGRLLMRHIDSYTPDERKRYDELIELCKDHANAFNSQPQQP